MLSSEFGTEAPIYVIVDDEGEDPSDYNSNGSRKAFDIGPTFDQTVEQIKHRLGKRVPLDAQALKSSMGGLIRVVGDVFQQAGTQTGLELESVKLTVEISSESQVNLVGTGGKLGGKGAIELTFKKKQP